MPKVYDKVEYKRKPEWLKINIECDENSASVSRLIEQGALHTICTSGRCPNKAECWKRRTATFMILGDVCTRNCRFCATKTGRPLPTDPTEPLKVAQSIRIMDLRHAVVTSVTRDDLPDEGARHWAKTVESIREINPEVTIELLIPDLHGRKELLDIVLASRPDIIGHNIETVERFTPIIRSSAEYRRSLQVLSYISSHGSIAKSGLMLGLGETEEEIRQALKDLAQAGCSIVTLGQYLRPTKEHYPVADYITPEKFEEYKEYAYSCGFDYVASGPLVRSSYLADMALEHIKNKLL